MSPVRRPRGILVDPFAGVLLDCPRAKVDGHHLEAPIDLRIDDLLRRMTFAEKIDQLHQSGIGDTNPNNLAARADEFRPTYGSYILGGSPTILETRNAIQRRAVEESRLSPERLRSADEAFLTSSIRGVLPIAKIDGQTLRGGAPGPVTAAIMDQYAAFLRRVAGGS